MSSFTASSCRVPEFYDDMAKEWDRHRPNEIILGLETSMDMLVNKLMDLKVCMVAMVLVKET